MSTRDVVRGGITDPVLLVVPHDPQKPLGRLAEITELIKFHEFTAALEIISGAWGNELHIYMNSEPAEMMRGALIQRGYQPKWRSI